jgi:GTP-binding protein
MSSTFAGYQIKTGNVSRSTQGFLVASQAGISVAFGLTNAQERGKTMIGAGRQVYEGMIVGLHTRPADLAVNVCKEKKLTNMRSSTADIITKLIKPLELSLEESLDIISEEELIEITPDHLRLRKRILPTTERLRFEKRIKQTDTFIK